MIKEVAIKVDVLLANMQVAVSAIIAFQIVINVQVALSAHNVIRVTL